MNWEGSSNRHCLICCQQLEETKPLVIREDVKDACNDQLNQFKQSLNCFCGLLNICDNEETVNAVIEKAIGQSKRPLSSEMTTEGLVKQEEDEQLFLGLPCCEGCCGALNDIVSFQKAMDEMKINQMELVDTLKTSLLSADTGACDENEDSWLQIRTQLINSIFTATLLSQSKGRKSPPSSEDVRIPETKLRKPKSVPKIKTRNKRQHVGQVEASFSKVARACSVILTKIVPSTPVTATPNPDSVHSKSQPCTDIKLESRRRSGRNSEVGRNKQSKIVPEIENDSDADYIPSAGENEASDDDDNHLSSATYSVTKANDDDYLPPQRSPKKRKSDSTKKKKPPKQQLGKWDKPEPAPRKHRKIPGMGVRPNTLFWIIDEHTLIYRYSLIHVSHGGTQLKCLEQECPVYFQDFHYSTLFEKMRDHVDTVHYPSQNKVYDTSQNTCPDPTCRQVFEGGANFRTHYARTHTLEMVVCEICWKPTRHVADVFRIHKWTHKNAQEQADAESERPLATIRDRAPYRRKKGEPLKPPPPIDSPAEDFFVRLQDNLLLYKFTVAKINFRGASLRLHCLEPDCLEEFLTTETDYQAFEEFKGHVKNSHLDNDQYASKRRRCPLCPADNFFTDGYAFKNHIHDDHSSCPYICESCWKPFPSVYRHRIPAHQKSHESFQDKQTSTGRNERWLCPECGKAFATKTNLYNHRTCHVPKSEKTKFQCPHCSSILSSKAGLQGHVERKHRPDLKRFRNCPICNQQFNYRDSSQYKVHMRGHNNERPFVCELCGKGFKDRATFRSHLEKVHSEERPYQCEFCESSFKYPDNLSNHKYLVHKEKVPDMKRAPKKKEIKRKKKIAMGLIPA